MNRPIRVFGALAALAFGLSAQASLVLVGAEIIVSENNEGAQTIGYAVNSATGEYVVCYNHFVPGLDTLKCRLFDAQDQPITPSWFAHSHGSSPIEAIDIDVADDGRFYVATVDASRTGRVYGWDRAGTALFAPITLASNVFWTDVDVASVPGGFWTAATRQTFDLDDMQTFVFVRNIAGALTHQFNQPEYGFLSPDNCSKGDSSDVAATRSGDIALVFIKAAAGFPCLGTVMVQTYRLDTTPTSLPRAISKVVKDGSGIDVSVNIAPRVGAVDSGRFVLEWFGESQIVTASIGATGSVLVPATDLQAGIFPGFAVNPATGDFAVTRFINNCDFESQLAIEGDVNPRTVFGVGTCLGVQSFATQFERDSRLRVARARATGATLSHVDLPAQIEINNVFVSEGDPVPGSPPDPPPAAAITVSLTKSHPNGEDVQVTYFTRNGSAVAGEDFALTRDTAVFSGSASQTASTILLPILPDTRYEDDEAFTVELELPNNAVIRGGLQRSNVVIRDDDETPPITPDCDNGDAFTCRTIPEPDLDDSTEALVTLTLAQPVGINVQVNYATQDGTAQAGSDYAARTGQVQFLAGATTAVIPLTILGDELPEDTETFRLRLSAPAGVTLAATELVLHILDDAICFLEVAPPDIVTTRNGGSETLNVTTRPGCDWSVSTPDDWISITSPANNTGSGSITLDIAPFDAPPGVFERSGSVVVTLANPLRTVTVPVDQDGDCSFVVDPASQQFAVEGGTVTFAVDASVPQCAWTVTSPAPWITILSPLAPVFGDGTVSYQIDANADQVDVEEGSRSIALASEEFTYDVMQDGCTYTLDANDVAATAAGDTSYFVDIDAQTVCRWTAVSHASWILIQDGASGTGEGTVEVFVLDNPTVQSRVGTVSIGDETLTVTQAGLECDYVLSPANLVSCPDGRAFSLDVTATDGCSWTLHTEADWAELVSGDSGTGSDQVHGLVEVNLSEVPRAATLQLRAQNIGVATTSVMQEGYLTYELFDVGRPPDWSYQPDAAWSAAGGSLIGLAPPSSTSTALDQASTCRECEVSARVAVTTASSGPGEGLTVLGWYRDAVNYVGFAMDEFSNRWILYQVVNGTRFSVMSDVPQILPNTSYDVHLVFDGTTFVAELGGQPLLQMPVQGDPPKGSAGLRLTASNGRLSELRINAVEGSSTPVLSAHIFASGFEPGETQPPPEAPNTSQCRLQD